MSLNGFQVVGYDSVIASTIDTVSRLQKSVSGLEAEAGRIRDVLEANRGSDQESQVESFCFSMIFLVAFLVLNQSISSYCL